MYIINNRNHKSGTQNKVVAFDWEDFPDICKRLLLIDKIALKGENEHVRTHFECGPSLEPNCPLGMLAHIELFINLVM